ncbi:MAG: exodeoxyribonuclease small subunit [Micavibrio sp.]|nr:exodeoxyribonuclease small subunit [Micavibrio sp.]
MPLNQMVGMAKESSSVETLSFESALAELDTIVKGLESGKTNLEESISAYERGVALKKHCEKKLQEAQAKIEKITVGPDGKIGTAPFDTE